MAVIEDFIARYKKEYDFYDQAGRLTAQLLDGRLQAAGIRSIVTSRAKSPGRLESKVRARESRKNYLTADDIFADIVDLAGTRVALYFPEQRDQVDALVRQLFTVLEQKNFPEASSSPTYSKRFSGYWATHYRVQIREQHLADAQKRYAEARVEIQVASVLMHAWSEVEHDLVYKPLQGSLSGAEYDILDELNGLVIAGEIALKRLQSAGQARVKQGQAFGNHYELAAFILANSPAQPPLGIQQGLGAVDVLFSLLFDLKLATPDLVRPYLAQVHSDLERRPISEQIVDLLLSEDEERYPIYHHLRAIIGDEKWAPQASDAHEALGYFMSQWIEFERTVRVRTRGGERGPPVPSPLNLVRAGIIDRATAERLEPIRRLRNEVVHGVFVGDPGELRDAAERLGEIITSLGPPPA
jgi:ppGpp synthetase/RelA/SpoT-type nucleotidyltranferase